jgi:hypothetical protein
MPHIMAVRRRLFGAAPQRSLSRIGEVVGEFHIRVSFACLNQRMALAGFPAYEQGQWMWHLRSKARQALGERFSLKDFHNAVLTAGTLPIDMLEREVDTYIRSAARR